MSGPQTITLDLDYPVTVGGMEYANLTFRRMKAKDALVAEEETNKARAGYLIFAALAGVDVSVIEELDIADLEKVGEAVVPLMGKSASATADKSKTAA